MRNVPIIHFLPLIALALGLSVCMGGCWPSSTVVNHPSNVDLATVAARYLDDHIFAPTFGGHVFCETEILHLERQGSAIKAYVWALCIEYYKEGQTMQMGTAVSEPLVVYMIEHEDSTLASGFAESRDGALFAEDIQQMFPDEAVERMCLGDIPCRNARVHRLEGGIAEQVRRAYNLPIATAPWNEGFRYSPWQLILAVQIHGPMGMD